MTQLSLTKLARLVEQGSVVRGQSRCTCLVCGHDNNKPIDLTDDVINVSTTSTFQGAQASITLVPRKHYRNFIFPNDIVLLYLMPGTDEPDGIASDGLVNTPKDEVRVFIGYVDRISRSTSVIESSTGRTQTRFHLQCSGFTKALQRTQVYYNPHVSSERLFGAVLAGLSFLTSGVPLGGTPTTIARGLLLAYLGFGGQWQLPNSYPLQYYATGSGLQKQVQQAVYFEELLGFKNVRAGTQPGLLSSVQTEVGGTTLKVADRSLMGLLDLFTYVEDHYVQGQTAGSPQYAEDIMLWDLIQQHANTDLNECFIDLRIDTERDIDEFGKSPAYRPALVMREFPYNTDDITLGVNVKDSELKFKFANVFFSDRKNKVFPDVLQNFEGSNNPLLKAATQPGRYLDRVQITSAEILDENVGMGDQDVVNYFQAYSDLLMLQQSEQKFLLMEAGILPLINIPSIRRHGLRIRESLTKYANQLGARVKESQASDAIKELVRMALVFDMWHQRNQYLDSGSLTFRRLIPKLRVGYRLDVIDQGISYYVTSVSHTWAFPKETGGGAGSTSVEVVRGRPRNTTFNYIPPESVKVLFLGGQANPFELINTFPSAFFELDKAEPPYAPYVDDGPEMYVPPAVAKTVQQDDLVSLIKRRKK